MTRRSLLPGSDGALFRLWHSKAAPYQGNVKIIKIEAMQTKMAGICLDPQCVPRQPALAIGHVQRILAERRIHPLERRATANALGTSNSLKRQIRIPRLTGEKLEMPSGFKTWPLRVAFTGTRKIAARAQALRMPVALHNGETLVLTHASAHFAAGIQNFCRSESPLGRPTGQEKKMAAGTPPNVANGLLEIPEGREFEPGETMWS